MRGEEEAAIEIVGEIKRTEEGKGVSEIKERIEEERRRIEERLHMRVET